MRQARYEFDPNKRYLASAVDAKLVAMPSVERVVSAIKVTLSTPHEIVGKETQPSDALEAMIWAFPHEVDDVRFLRDAGVVFSVRDGVASVSDSASSLECR